MGRRKKHLRAVKPVEQCAYSFFLNIYIYIYVSVSVCVCQKQPRESLCPLLERKTFASLMKLELSFTHNSFKF